MKILLDKPIINKNNLILQKQKIKFIQLLKRIQNYCIAQKKHKKLIKKRMMKFIN